MSIQVTGVPEDGIRLMVRMPGYAERFRIRNGQEEAAFEDDKGYAAVNVASDGVYEVSFEAPAQFVRANPKVRADVGRVAFVRGPLVYCLEEIDNGENLSGLYVDTGKKPEEEMSGQFGGSVILHAKGERIAQASWGEELYSTVKSEREPVILTAVPYAFWNNRGRGEMAVWVKEC